MVKTEGRSLALHAGNRDFAAHQFDQPFGDGEAQAGAAMSPGRGGVPLLKRLEQKWKCVGRDAHSGVADQELELVQVVLHRRRRHLEGDVAFVGEFDGIADEIEQNLPHAGGIAEEGARHVGLDEGDEVDLVAPRG